MKERIVTIDGPSGSGKGTIAQIVAKRLGWGYLDSGALYRLVGFLALRKGVDSKNSREITKIAEDLTVEFKAQANGLSIWFLGENVTEAIRSEECSSLASQVSAILAVRKALLVHQRALFKPPGLVADGRDMGTVVFPKAALKIFLTASSEVRAQRRYKQLKEKSIRVSLPDVFKDLLARDKRDQERNISPLKPAEEAVIIDTSKLSIEEVVDCVMKCARNVFNDLS